MARFLCYTQKNFRTLFFEKIVLKIIKAVSLEKITFRENFTKPWLNGKVKFTIARRQV